MNDSHAAEEYFDCNSSTYTAEVCKHVTQRVMGEMFQPLQTAPYLLTDYHQFNASHQAHFHENWTQLFPRGDAVTDPFAPIFPPQNPLETRLRTPANQRNLCASATLTGFRCVHHILYPLTVCAVHAQYFVTHLYLPPGGTTHPQIPHRNDVNNGGLIDFDTPETKRVPTTPTLRLIQKANSLRTPSNTLMRPPRPSHSPRRQ